jgi:hypothetical protein
VSTVAINPSEGQNECQLSKNECQPKTSVSRPESGRVLAGSAKTDVSRLAKMGVSRPELGRVPTGSAKMGVSRPESGRMLAGAIDWSAAVAIIRRKQRRASADKRGDQTINPAPWRQGIGASGRQAPA